MLFAIKDKHHACLTARQARPLIPHPPPMALWSFFLAALSRSPRLVVPGLLRSVGWGGRVVPGPARPGARRREFVSGPSRGTWFTCSFAASLGLPVVVFPACAPARRSGGESSAGRPVQGPSSLQPLGPGRWVPLRCWSGAFRWVPGTPKNQSI